MRILLALVLNLVFVSMASANLNVVTTTPDLAEIVKAVGGDQVNVKSICRGDQDPHHLQAKPSYMLMLSRADLVVKVGLDLEVGWLPLLIQGGRNPKVLPGKPGFLDASTAIVPIGVRKGPVDRSMGDVHPRGNPHYWLDPHNTKLIASRIAKRLSTIDAKHAPYYAKNLQTMLAKRDKAIARWEKRMAKYRGEKVASYHQTFDYFIRRFRLLPSGYIEERPGIPPGPSYLSGLTKRLKEAQVKVIFHEVYFERRASDLVANKTGASIVQAPTSIGSVPEARDYESLIDTLIDRFIAAVEKP